MNWRLIQTTFYLPVSNASSSIDSDLLPGNKPSFTGYTERFKKNFNVTRLSKRGFQDLCKPIYKKSVGAN